MPTTSILSVFIFSFLVGLGAVISPGPVSTAIVSQAPRRGWFVGPLVATGHSMLELILVVLIFLGLGSVLALGQIQTAIAFLGGLLLFWMGGTMVREVYHGGYRLPTASDSKVSLTSRQL